MLLSSSGKVDCGGVRNISIEAVEAVVKDDNVQKIKPEELAVAQREDKVIGPVYEIVRKESV